MSYDGYGPKCRVCYVPVPATHELCHRCSGELQRERQLRDHAGSLPTWESDEWIVKLDAEAYLTDDEDVARSLSPARAKRWVREGAARMAISRARSHRPYPNAKVVRVRVRVEVME